MKNTKYSDLEYLWDALCDTNENEPITRTSLLLLVFQAMANKKKDKTIAP